MLAPDEDGAGISTRSCKARDACIAISCDACFATCCVDFGRPSNDARAGRAHKKIVRCDVADADDVADLCYSRFFELASDTRALFPSDMKRQRLRLMDTIAALVGSLDQRELFESLVTVFRPPARQIWRSIALCRNGRSVDVES